MVAASPLQPGSARARASLDRALAYRNPEVVARFRKEYPVSGAEAREVWRETKKWLWLCGNNEKLPLTVTTSMAVIDEMWHAFVLFTPDYTAFCRDQFGRYIHHLPNTHADNLRFRAAMKADPQRVTRAYEMERRSQYETVVAHLGERTLRRWYVDYAVQYSPAVLRRLRRRGLREE